MFPDVQDDRSGWIMWARLDYHMVGRAKANEYLWFWLNGVNGLCFTRPRELRQRRRHDLGSIKVLDTGWVGRDTDNAGDVREYSSDGELALVGVGGGCYCSRRPWGREVANGYWQGLARRQRMRGQLYCEQNMSGRMVVIQIIWRRLAAFERLDMISCPLIRA